MPPWVEVLGNGTIGGEEPLRVSGRLEALHAPIALAGGLIRGFRVVIQLTVLAVFYARQNPSMAAP
jgi:hypothetical protein